MSVTGSDDQWQWGCKGENGGADTAADACTADYASQTLSISADPTSIEVGETSEITASSDAGLAVDLRSEEHTSELQSRGHLVCRLLLDNTDTIFSLD